MGTYTEITRSFLIADLAGYASLTETHGNISAVNLIARYVDIVNMSLTHGAHLTERVGDEVLIISESTISLLETALDLVRNVEKEPEFLSVHIGIHTGDVIEQDGKYFGSALNLCSRISSYSRGGQILCSRNVVDDVVDSESYQFNKIDEVSFKNMANLVSIYELITGLPKTGISIDPVCKMQVDRLNPPARTPYNNTTYNFCSFGCLEQFLKNPKRYL